MNKDYITLETAVLAREKGYKNLHGDFGSTGVDNRNSDHLTYDFYRVYSQSMYERESYPLPPGEPKVELCTNISTRSSNIFGFRNKYSQDNMNLVLDGVDYFQAPKQYELQTWLREEKGIVVIVDIDIDSSTNYHFFVYNGPYEYSGLFQAGAVYTKWEHALEVGLLHGLKLL